MRIIRGFTQARNLFKGRSTFDVMDVPHQVVEQVKQTFGQHSTPLEAVRQIIVDIRCRGDDALKEYTLRLDGVELHSLEVSKERLVAAYEHVDTVLVDSLQLAAERIRMFHETTRAKGWIDRQQGLGELMVPLERVGLYAPGGTAAYPSTVLMGAIPAKVAGVQQVVLCTPCSRDGAPPPATLVAAHMAGVDQLFALGGAQAIAAMAYGTESVPRVDKICGPGNWFVTLAKKEVYGSVDIDGLYGPTETLLIADGFADPAWCAADLLAQAEHDVTACPVLVTTSPEVANGVSIALNEQINQMERKAIAQESIKRQGLIVVVDVLEEAFELANLFAPEHLCLLVRDPWTYLDKVQHVGGVFVGHYSPEVIGDYVAGPSHTMPTGGTARFASYLGVHHFLRPIPVVGIDKATFQRLGPAAAAIARAEGLPGHAFAVDIRMDSRSQP